MTTHTDLDPADLDVDALECFGWRLTQEASHEAWFTWAVHDHPVLERIRTLADHGVIPDHHTLTNYGHRAGTALAQTVTSGEAQGLAEHFARVWELPQIRPALTPAEAGQTTPGGVLGHLYGVEITVEDPILLVAEARGDDGKGFAVLLNELLPPGTRPGGSVTARALGPEDYAPERLRSVRQSVAETLGEPHILIDLPLESVVSEAVQRVREQDPDALAGMDEADLTFPDGYRALFGLTLCAIPGKTSHIVVRPSQSLTDAGAWVRGDWDGRRIDQATHTLEGLPVPIVYETARYSEPTPDLAGLGPRPPRKSITLRPGNGFAWATGRIEVHQDGTVAEVYEVTAQ
ncbi:hypothetical protein GCM10017673_39100 [Streptosporangium violaceochromogenes]|nr:hypothetical protein GCM10017673_39100 [Streptosporangium violaceochromogenes]